MIIDSLENIWFREEKSHEQKGLAQDCFKLLM